MDVWIVEAIGYLASLLIAVSLLMVSILKLRVINLFGSMVFVVYGVLLGSVPLMLTNLFIIGVNTMNLIKLRSGTDGIRYAEIDTDHLTQVEDFARESLSDIHRYFPRFCVEQIAAAESAGGRVFAAIRHLRVVGFAVVFPVAAAEQVLDRAETAAIARSESSGDEMCFLIDYILPRYRDLGLVRGLHELVIHQAGPDVSSLLATVDSRSRRHAGFLRRNGFIEELQHEEVRLFRKPLGSTAAL
ncbi:YgjV family protein [Spirochaeta africana]|uniref:Bacterial inner membrane protein n=1 Tax=Spirochaeta africana (strain ATCC 700263 / DSM 8902 / Z-7692) TaxID=889378 RepID=H9UHR9_SPIAZ|nr:YgjV family protein [Spirochaeta africana]AFG37062.1 Bacterial inner membrane protein [Spirochaeta africana DSM 8902]